MTARIHLRMDHNYYIIRELLEEKKRQEAIIAYIDAEISKAPEGKVSVRMHHGHLELYFRDDPKDRHGIYLPVSKREFAGELIQKQHLENARVRAQSQLKEINRFLKKYDPDIFKKLYIREGPLRQQFLKPIDVPDELFAAEWQSFEYERKGFADNLQEHYTRKNERVRSKSEVLIADALYAAGIPYRYECPLKIGSRIIYPDFTILRMYDRKILYWEHLGLMDEMDYRNEAFAKGQQYRNAGIFLGDQLIITYETGCMPLNNKTLHQVIKHYLLTPE